MFENTSLLVWGHNTMESICRGCNKRFYPSPSGIPFKGTRPFACNSIANKYSGTHTHHGVQGGVPLVGLPQAEGLQLVVAAVALQLSLPAQSVQKGPSFQEGPHCQEEQRPQRLEAQLDHGL